MDVNGLCSDVANIKALPSLGKAERGKSFFIYITIYFITFLPSTIYRPLPIALMSLPMTRPSIE